jgi:hypothetical protein
VTAATEALLVLARVRDGREQALRGALAALGAGTASPFARVAGTHLARLTPLAPPARRRALGRRRTPPLHLLLAADVDAPAARWVDRLLDAIPAELDSVLGHCERWPGAADGYAARAWLQDARLPAGFSVIGSPEATVAQVGSALTLRERLADLAMRGQDLDPVALHGAWHALSAALPEAPPRA